MQQSRRRKAHVTKRRDVRIHAELWHTSNCLLSAGQEKAEASAHQFRASLVFRAFSLEAFLNWLGPQLIPHWKYLERLKPKDKLDVLANTIHVTPDYSSRPWQIVKDLFGFRNDIAHGKPETLSTDTLENINEHLDGKLGQFVRTDWERFCTEENALKAKEDVLKIATILYKKANLKHDGPIGPFAAGFQIHGATL